LVACTALVGVVFAWLASPASSGRALPTTQLEALVAFKASGGVANTAPLASWTGSNPCQGWAGVTCRGWQGDDANAAFVAAFAAASEENARAGASASAAVETLMFDVNAHPEFRQLEGDVGALAPLVELRALHLDKTRVMGDVAALAPLAKLQMLSLYNTKVVGDVKGLVPLERLTILCLTNTEVSGDVKGLSLAKQLTNLHLTNTMVSGDVKGLAPLVKLVDLTLVGTNMSGDVKGLTPLVKLTSLYLDGNVVSGCAAFCADSGSFHAHCDPHPGPKGCSCSCLPTPALRPAYYGVEITSVNSDGTYDIKFEDGEEKRGVKENQLEGDNTYGVSL
jgi:hypothetical protein